MTRKSLVSPVALFVAFVAGGFLSGCGKPPQQESIKTNAVFSLTGTRADVGRANALQVAMNDLNAAGGPGGKTLELVRHDTESSETKAAELATGLRDEGVEVLFTGSSDNSVPVIKAVTIPSKVFVFATGTSSPSLTTELAPQAGGFFVRTSPGSDVAAKRLANMAYADGVRTIGVIYSDESFGKAYKDDFVKPFTTTLGGTLTGTPPAPQAIPAGTVQNTYLTQLQNASTGATLVAGKRAVMVVTGPSVFKVLLRDAALNNISVQWYGAHTNRDPSVLAADPVAAEGMRGLSPERGKDANYQPYEASFKAAYAEGNPAGTWYPHIYDAMVVYGLTLAKAGANTAVAIKDNVRAVANAGTGKQVFGPGDLKGALDAIKAGKDLDYQGASGSVDFDANGDIQGGFVEYKVQGGQFVEVPQ